MKPALCAMGSPSLSYPKALCEVYASFRRLCRAQASALVRPKKELNEQLTRNAKRSRGPPSSAAISFVEGYCDKKARPAGPKGRTRAGRFSAPTLSGSDSKG